jgi:trk system potassium uptake protein TrkH
VEIVRLDKKPVREETISQISVFLMLYTAITIVSVLVVSLDAFDFDTTFSSVLACLNNIGPGLGVVGPVGNNSGFGALSKIIRTVDMSFGRLEIYLFCPSSFPACEKQDIKPLYNRRFPLILPQSGSVFASFWDGF